MRKAVLTPLRQIAENAGEVDRVDDALHATVRRTVDYFRAFIDDPYVFG